MKKITLILAASLAFTLISWNAYDDFVVFPPTGKLSDLLISLGDEKPTHYRENPTAELIERGRALVHNGKAIGPDGKMGPFISKYFACTSCHNQVQEDPIITKFDPQARLDYAAENDLKFLPATTFWGIYNRESWYNDDYILKYGDLVVPASKSLEESTQLCAKVCSSGRYLEDWELEAILAYYESIQLTINDLDLTESDREVMRSDAPNEEKLALIKSKYATKSPATFPKAPENKIAGYAGLIGNSANGKKIYELSCQACHQDGGVSPILLDDAELTFKKFKNNFNKNGDWNIYDIILHGTYADKGKPRYMPLYPKERMSPQQIEDLRAYIVQEAR